MCTTSLRVLQNHTLEIPSSVSLCVVQKNLKFKTDLKHVKDNDCQGYRSVNFICADISTIWPPWWGYIPSVQGSARVPGLRYWSQCRCCRSLPAAPCVKSHQMPRQRPPHTGSSASQSRYHGYSWKHWHFYQLKPVSMLSRWESYHETFLGTCLPCALYSKTCLAKTLPWQTICFWRPCIAGRRTYTIIMYICPLHVHVPVCTIYLYLTLRKKMIFVSLCDSMFYRQIKVLNFPICYTMVK